MKDIVVISKCIKNINKASIFQFRGVYLGKRITQVKISKISENHFEQGQVYILHLRPLSIDNKIINSRLIKFKSIEYQ